MDKINTELVQTRIPPTTKRAGMIAAAKKGISFASWLRQVIAKAVGHDKKRS
jgi:predicted HicB family RNase H-like nuclease